MKLTKLIAAAAIATAFVSVPASAGVIGMADLVISSLTIVGTSVPPDTSISITNETRRGIVNTEFDGTTGGSNSGLVSGAGATVDSPYSCLGSSCGALGLSYGTIENNGTTHIATTNGDYSLGDMYITGNALGGSSNGLTRADTSVSGPNNTSNADSSIKDSVSSTVTFSIDETLTAQFALTYDAYIAAIVDAAVTPNESAYATGQINWSLTLSKVGVGTPVLSWSPDPLNVGATSYGAAQNFSSESSGNLTSNLVTLGAGTYTLTIFQSSTAAASEIPEPGTSLLIGLGLLGLAAAARRRTRQ